MGNEERVYLECDDTLELIYGDWRPPRTQEQEEWEKYLLSHLEEFLVYNNEDSE